MGRASKRSSRIVLVEPRGAWSYTHRFEGPIQRPRESYTKRRREDARIYPVYLTPRDPKLVSSARQTHLPLEAVAEAMTRALLTEWSTDLKVITREAKTTALENVYKVGLNEEELALQFRLVYSERSNKSIDIIHRQKRGRDKHPVHLHQGAATQGAQ